MVINLRRIKLKHKRKKSRISKFIIVTFLIIVVAFLIIDFVGKRISEKMIDFTMIEVNKISKIIVNKAVNETVLNELDTDNLFVVERNINNDIQLIDFNTLYVNKILSSISNNVIKYFEELEDGYSSIIDIKENLVTNTQISSNKKGVIFEIPIGVISNNPLFSNIGPKIPIKLSLNGDLESSIKTKTENYGINNSIITVYVNIKVNEQIILPITTKQNIISNDIPIAIKIIQGNIPNYYFSGINSSSNLLSVPFNS